MSNNKRNGQARRRMNSAALCLLAVTIALLFMLNGCSVSGGFKTATADNTPETRIGERHSFPEIERETADGDFINHDLKVGFIFNGNIGDYGFTYAQNQGRLELARELGVETFWREMVTPGEHTIEMIQELIDEGCTVIFSCSFGFMEDTAFMAEQNPDIFFFHCSGYMTSDNMATYFGRMYQMRYLSGIVAGLRTQTNLIGYVAAQPIPEVRRGINAFALGVQSVNPDAVVHVAWTNTWLSTGLERELALELVQTGCDVIAQHQDSLQPQIVAEESGIWGIGYNSPMGFRSPNAYLTAPLWNWGPFMIEQVQQIIDGTWESGSHWDGLETGIVQLEELTANVAPGTHEAVELARLRILDGFDVFTGPIYDNDGVLRVLERQTIPDSEKLATDWLLNNVREIVG